MVLRKAHMCSTLSLRSLPSVAFETVPMLAGLMTSLSRPFKEDGPSAFPFYASILWAIDGVMSLAFSTLQLF